MFRFDNQVIGGDLRIGQQIGARLNRRARQSRTPNGILRRREPGLAANANVEGREVIGHYGSHGPNHGAG
jgi:hypothetical protein